MAQSPIKKFSLITGTLLAVALGLFYIIATALLFNNTLEWFLFTFVATYCSGFAMAFSDVVKNKKGLSYALKTLGVLCILAFMLIVIKYTDSVGAQDGFSLLMNICQIVATITAIIQMINIVASENNKSKGNNTPNKNTKSSAKTKSTKNGHKTINQSLIKKITLIVGGLLVIALGLFYILFTDLLFNNTAKWLFLSIFSALGSGICALLSESIRNKKFFYYILKIVGVLCIAAFVMVVLKYITQVDIIEVVKVKKTTSIEVQKGLNMVGTVCLIGSIVAAVFQVCNIGMNVIFGIDE